MRNRAKCKLCQTVLESFHEFDYVKCVCDEISISGGNVRNECAAKNWENFLRIDDSDREIAIQVIDKDDEFNDAQLKLSNTVLNCAPSKDNLIKLLDKMVEDIENLPNQAMLSPINHYDFCSLIMLISSIFKSELKEIPDGD